MFGWSLGTLYTLWYSATHTHSLDGIILAAPYWVGFMPRIFSSKLSSKLRSSPNTIYDAYKNWSKDFGQSEEGKILLQDPLFTTKRSWRWLSGVKRNLSDKALQNASQIKNPTLIILGEQDDTTIRTGAKQILESLATKDKIIHTFPDADHFLYHAIFLKATAKHEPAKRKHVTSIIKDWLNTH